LLLRLGKGPPSVNNRKKQEMRYRKGESGNLAGRPQGTENIATGQVRKLWSDLVLENIDQLKKDFRELKPKDRLSVAVKLSNYLLPRLQSIQYDVYPEWADLLRLTEEERASELIRLKKKVQNNEDEGED